jgi:hypothetical protein
MLEVTRENILTQKVFFATRRHTNGKENILDLLLTSHPALHHSTRPHPGIGDHSAVLSSFDIKTTLPKKPARSVPQWRSVDEADFKQKMKIIADNFLASSPENKTIEDNWTSFRDSINNLVNTGVPHKTFSGKRGAPWFNNAIKKED